MVNDKAGINDILIKFVKFVKGLDSTDNSKTTYLILHNIFHLMYHLLHTK